MAVGGKGCVEVTDLLAELDAASEERKEEDGGCIEFVEGAAEDIACSILRLSIAVELSRIHHMMCFVQMQRHQI